MKNTPKHTTIFLLPACICLASFFSCTDMNKAKELEESVVSLEQRLSAVEKKVEKIEKKAFIEEDAQKAFKEIQGLIAQDKIEAAKKSLPDFFKKYGSTKTAKGAKKLNAELAVVGKDLPAKWGIEKWFQGKDQIDLASKEKCTLIVFWETWCPHCRRVAPDIQKTHDNFKDQGLQVIGVTKINRSATEEKVVEFIKSNNLSYPIAKEDGYLTKYFNVSGVPAAAVISKGKIVWRGHPARLKDTSIKALLGMSE